VVDDEPFASEAARRRAYAKLSISVLADASVNPDRLAD
jgi:hypothetical protein